MTQNVSGHHTVNDVVNAMVGRVIENLYPKKQNPAEASEDIVLDVRNLSDSEPISRRVV